MKHAKKIERYDWSLAELGEDIGNLDYDILVELFEILSVKFQKDAVHDKELWHPQVAQKLGNISISLKEVLEKDVKKLADLCREYNEKVIK